IFLHLRNIVVSLVKGQHLPVVDNHPSDMELLKGLFKVVSIVPVAVEHNEELPELLVESHAGNIQVRQLPIVHICDQVVELINLGRIKWHLDERASDCSETISRWRERRVYIPLEQK